jgi:uncharacterized protein YegL
MDLTEIVCIIDRSGSMASVIDDAIGGFNTFLQKQQEIKDNPAIMTVALFNHTYQLLHDGMDVMSVKPFTHATYVPDGMTALFDAVGKTMNNVNERIEKAADKEKVPKKVLYVILTDGHENSSREFKKQQILNMIEAEKKKNREVIFLGADAAAFDPEFVHVVGSAQTMGFAPTGAGTRQAYNCLCSASMSYRATGGLGDWKDHDTGFGGVSPPKKKSSRHKGYYRT